MSSNDHGPESETTDASADQIAVDSSVGSNTDTEGPSKSEVTPKDGQDQLTNKHHVRSDSIKKPTTFKAVSVTKNFLAKAGTPTAAAPKTNGDNATPTASVGTAMPPAPRPRLVAKSASGTKGSTPKSSHFGSRNGGGSGPDPMQVWNRNRAAPQPAPKHFTDEELKQQYGIHLATRLQADGDGKEAKWADIDDDEDDWAPETIEWNDGTKITLTQNDTASLLAEEQAAAEATKKRQEEENKNRVAAQQKPTTTVGPNATVLKPRSIEKQKSGGLVLKAPSEKPTLVAKPAAPAPVRSPWASLPPVDRAPPVDINPPTHQVSPREPNNERYGNNLMPTPALPAVEIAADDFSRSRRDNQNGNPGQLYNAQSGRYEPANAGRRGSVRKDQNFRPPSLLLRGSNNDQHAPAEPSAAFQARRGSQQEGSPWTRRGSSTRSGDFGPQGRRMSTSKGSISSNDQHRRDSQHSQPLQSPESPAFAQHRPGQDSQATQQPTTSAIQSPALEHSQAAQSTRPLTGMSQDGSVKEREDVTVQKQLMREKRELAIKRKKEEEEWEEAAKKERIRLKMESLGMPPLDEKKEQKPNPQKVEIEKRIPEAIQTEKEPLPKTEVSKDVSQAAEQPQNLPFSSAKSPPKPPAPHASGAPQQYGMMRVHGAPANNVLQSDSDRINVDKLRSPAPQQKISPPILQTRAEGGERLPSPTVNGITMQKHAELFMHNSPDIPNQNAVRDSRQQSWNHPLRDPNMLPGWNGQGVTRDSPAGNSVWGAPSPARPLGNGAFERGIQRPRSRQQEQFNMPTLAPIGPPKHVPLLRDHREPNRAHDMGPTSLMEDFQTIPTFPPTEAPRPVSSSDLNRRSTGAENKISPPGFASGPQSRTPLNNMEHSVRGSESHRLAAWSNFPDTSAKEDAEKNRQRATRFEEEIRTGIQRESPQLPIMHETFRHVVFDEQTGKRRIDSVSRGLNTHGQLLPHVNGAIQNATFGNTSHVPPVSAGRVESRYFPSTNRGGMQLQYPFMPHRRSSSPPPPDSAFHPAYASDYGHPLVKLPMVKDRPKVRLPPSVVSPIQSPAMAAMQPIPLRAVSQPLVNNPSWQDRFNGLLGVKKSSPERYFAQVAAFSATKEPLDLPASAAVDAAVTLPPKSSGVVGQSATLQIESRDLEEKEALFDAREPGSLPVVMLPIKKVEPAWSTVRPLKHSPNRQLRESKKVEPESKKTFEEIEKEIGTEGGILIFVHLAGMENIKSTTLPRPNWRVIGQRSMGRDQQQQQQRLRNFSGNNKLHKGFKSRESSGNYNQHPRISQGGPPRNVSHNHHARMQPVESPWANKVVPAH